MDHDHGLGDHLCTCTSRSTTTSSALLPLTDAWVTWSHKWTCRFQVGATWAALLRAAVAANANA